MGGRVTKGIRALCSILTAPPPLLVMDWNYLTCPLPPGLCSYISLAFQKSFGKVLIIHKKFDLGFCIKRWNILVSSFMSAIAFERNYSRRRFDWIGLESDMYIWWMMHGIQIDVQDVSGSGTLHDVHDARQEMDGTYPIASWRRLPWKETAMAAGRGN